MSNDDYSISFGDAPPKVNPEGREKVREKVLKLVEDSFRILAKSLQLRRQAERNTVTIMEFCEKYKNVKPDDLGWEEREKLYAEAAYLMDKWREAYENLKELDKEYEEVRQRVNEHYGNEVMPERKSDLSNLDKMYEDMFGGDKDEGDWWKDK